MELKPPVSICTVTHRRPELLRLLEERIYSQTYPLDKIQWVILDDSPQPHKRYQETREEHSNLEIKYIHLADKLPLGKKRNEIHSHCDGEIIVYMDDDDFYPPSRVEHAVNSLLKSDKEIAGASIMPVLFIENHDLWMEGPHGENHATAGTLAFKRSFLENNSYSDEDTSAEERKFLNNYTRPMVQLDPFQTIMCISHGSNIHDKHEMIPEQDQEQKPEINFRKQTNLSDDQQEVLKRISQEHLAAMNTRPSTMKNRFSF